MTHRGEEWCVIEDSTHPTTPSHRLPLLAFDRPKQLPPGHAMGGVVRAGVHAARLAVQLAAQVAAGRLLLHDGHLAPGVGRVGPIFLERMHVDVAVRTVLRTLAAA